MSFGPVAWSLSFELSAPAQARRLVSGLCRDHHPGLDAEAWETVLLLVTELVTNAIQHGRAPLGLSVSDADDVFRVEVTDRNPSLPTVGPSVDIWSEGGRGLLLVAALSSAWGVTEIPQQGKTVWFELPPLDRRPDPLFAT